MLALLVFPAIAFAAPDAIPASEILARQEWDAHVRVLFMVVAAIACIASLVIVARTSDAVRARRWVCFVAAALFVIAVFGHAFFREPVTTALLCAISLVLAIIGVSVTYNAEAADAGTEPSQPEGDTQDE